MRVTLAALVLVGCAGAPPPAAEPPRDGAERDAPGAMLGTWVGESDGHRVEEVWSAPDGEPANGMVGAYRETDGSTVVFTEEMKLVPTPSGWRMQIHFFAGGPHPGGKEKQFEFRRVPGGDPHTITFENVNDDPVRRIVYALRGDEETITLFRGDTPESMTLRRWK